MVTFPIVRIMSGNISTATNRASGSIGTPIANAIGPIETTKLIEPGRLTEPMLIITPTKIPMTISDHDTSMPASDAT